MNLLAPRALLLPTFQEVHIWQLRCSRAQTVRAHWQTWLTPQESDRLQQYRHSGDRDRFIFSRGGLRYLLASYLGRSPAAIQLAYGSYGRPYLSELNPPLHFNLAHSGDWVIWGFSRCPYIGVDVEVLQPRRRLRSLIHRCLSAEERLSLAPDSAGELATFLQYWTIKEAHLKAVGLGLSYPLEKVQVTLQPQPAIRRPVHLLDCSVQAWAVKLWQPDSEAIAAVCIGQPDCAIQVFSLGATAPSPQVQS